MIDAFYYVGFLFLISCLEEIFNKKKRAETAIKLKEVYDTTLESGLMHGASNIPIKNIIKKTITRVRFFIGIIMLIWVVTGIVISDQRPIFIILLCIAVFPITLFIKDKKTQLRIMIFDNIICLILNSLILYNHFLK